MDTCLVASPWTAAAWPRAGEMHRVRLGAARRPLRLGPCGRGALWGLGREGLPGAAVWGSCPGVGDDDVGTLGALGTPATPAVILSARAPMNV